MRRLNPRHLLSPGHPLSPRHPLSRLREERGGVAVMVALLMPVLFGVSALAIDTAAVWSARQQVENGADAAVLAVAMDCARDECGNIKKTAEDAFFANNRAAKLSDLGSGEGQVSVNNRQVSVEQKRPWVVNHFFAAALGMGTGELSVQSYAEWAPAAGAATPLPLALSRCAYGHLRNSASGAPVTLPLKTDLAGSCTLTTGAVAGGSALTVPDSNSGCETTSTWQQDVRLHRGNGPPAGCGGSHLGGLVGTDVVVAIIDPGSDPAKPSYPVYGYSALRVTAYDAARQTLTGYFTRVVRQIDATTPPATSAPDLGARSVFLTEN